MPANSCSLILAGSKHTDEARRSVRDVLEVLVLHGAPEAILVDARPHIGSNRLPRVVAALRERLEGVGVGFRFGARVVELSWEERAGRRSVGGVRLADGSELQSLECLDLGGLYPCREGAGFAGGIVSAALDGMRVAARIAEAFVP